MAHAIHADSTRLYLIRHGATDSNLRKPYVLQGRSVDMSLSETGRKQAAATAAFLTGHGLTRVYSSRLKRAVETAKIIAESHDIEANPLADLHECDVGQWEGMDWATIERAHPDHYRAFLDDPQRVPYLGGECYGDVLRRTRPVIDDLLLRHRGEAIAVVAHNVVNRVLIAHLLGLDLGRARDLRQANGCINVIEGRGGETVLVTMNAIFHLDGLQT